MALQNRVTPEGDIIASPARGTMFGNRGGRIHGAGQRLTARRWHSKQWICCVLAFKGRRRAVMAPNRYTELFFLDEATALAAGHRPCFECRREAAMQFATLWNDALGLPGRARAPDMDSQLHAERVTPAGHKAVWRSRAGALPYATIVRLAGGEAALLTGGSYRLWATTGYGPPCAIPPSTEVEVLTPKSIVTVLGAGYRPVLHSSACD
jgi:hypothetical protein